MKRVIQISCLIGLMQAIPAIAALQNKPEIPEGETVVPYFFTGITYNDNLFLVSGPAEAREITGGTRTSDIVTRVGFGVRMKWPISLQTLRLDAAIARVDYQQFNNLDHYEGHAKLAWDWEIGRILDGTLSHSYRREMSSFSEFQQPVSDIRVLHETRLSGRYQFLTEWQVKLGGGRRDVDYERQDFLDREAKFAFAELQYATSVNTHVGLRVRYTDADLAPLPSPDGPINNDYEERRYSLEVGWEGSAKSYFLASLGYTHREREAGGSEFGGATGRLTYQWDITPATRIRASVYRQVSALDYQISSFVVTNGLSLRSSWQATPSATLQSHIQYEQSEFQGRVVEPGGNVVSAAGREDTVITAGAALEYSALSNLMLSLGVEYRKRDSNRPESDFDNTRVTVGLTYAFQ